MRILHLTDIHNDDSRWHWLFSQARAGAADVYVVSGDFVGGFYNQSLEQQIVMQRGFLTAFSMLPGNPRLVVASGNHDERMLDVPHGGRFVNWLSGFRAPGVCTDGQILNYMGYRFESVGYGSLPLHAGARTICVTHVPPARAATAIQHPENISFGDEDLAEQLLDPAYAPRFVLSGHIHRPRRWHALVGTSWSFNPGTGYNPPHHVLLDLDAGLATWRGSAGQIERISL